MTKKHNSNTSRYKSQGQFTP